jgi:fluoride exporter
LTERCFVLVFVEKSAIALIHPAMEFCRRRFSGKPHYDADDSYEPRVGQIPHEISMDLHRSFCSQGQRSKTSIVEPMRRLTLISLGGGLGSVARFAITVWFQPFHLWEPMSILTINVIGSFLIALVNFLPEPPVPGLRLGIVGREFLMVGICGGFTTFSSFAYLVYMAAARWNWADALLNIGLSHLLCLTAAWLGFLFCRAIQTTNLSDANANP